MSLEEKAVQLEVERLFSGKAREDQSDLFLRFRSDMKHVKRLFGTDW